MLAMAAEAAAGGVLAVALTWFTAAASVLWRGRVWRERALVAVIYAATVAVAATILVIRI